MLGALLRRHGSLGDCEDAAQEALVAAARQWPEEGVPGNPRGLADPSGLNGELTVDQVRTQTAQARREVADALARRLDDPGSADPTAQTGGLGEFRVGRRRLVAPGAAVLSPGAEPPSLRLRSPCAASQA